MKQDDPDTPNQRMTSPPEGESAPSVGEDLDDAGIRKALRGMHAPLSGLRRILEKNPFAKVREATTETEKEGKLLRFPRKSKR